MSVYATKEQTGPVTRVVFNQSTAATFEVVAAQGAGKKIRIVKAHLSGAAANQLTIKSASTVIGGPFDIAEGGGFIRINDDDLGWEQTAANEALNFTLGQAARVSGFIEWALVT